MMHFVGMVAYRLPVPIAYDVGLTLLSLVAAILIIARFCRPQSELHIESTWYRGTALEDLLGVPVDKVHTDRLYACLDWLLPLKPLVEKLVASNTQSTK